jgi:hypothetical protein
MQGLSASNISARVNSLKICSLKVFHQGQQSVSIVCSEIPFQPDLHNQPIKSICILSIMHYLTGMDIYYRFSSIPDMVGSHS